MDVDLNDLKDQISELSKKAELEEQFMNLSKKVDEQFRFTRNVLVLCTLVTIGLMIFTFLLTFQSLPNQTYFHFMSNLEPTVKLWKQYESLNQQARP